MNSSELKYFKNQLNEWLELLVQRSDIEIDGLRNSDERPIEVIEQAALENGRNLALRFRTREKFLIRKIQQSLRDIEAGDYGICSVCGGRIAIKRLKVRPVARHCIACKRKMEEKERLTGD